jgi:hypothetical protein
MLLSCGAKRRLLQQLVRRSWVFNPPPIVCIPKQRHCLNHFRIALEGDGDGCVLAIELDVLYSNI